MRPPPTTDLGRAIEVLNTRDTLRREPEQLPSEEVLGRFLRWIGRPELVPLVRDGDLARFREMRERLRLAFSAASEEEAIDGLNGLLRGYPAITQLVADGPARWRFRHEATEASDAVAALAPACGIALLAAIRDLGWSRLGTCHGSPCSCAYVDTTKNRSRRYCSDECNDRVAQARRRGRTAGASEAASRARPSD